MSDRPLEVTLRDDARMKYIDLSSLKIANCMGCFGCWTKTPGRCVIRDDATTVYPYIAQSEELLYVSRVKYGGYDTVMKTMLVQFLSSRHSCVSLRGRHTMCSAQYR